MASVRLEDLALAVGCDGGQLPETEGEGAQRLVLGRVEASRMEEKRLIEQLAQREVGVRWALSAGDPRAPILLEQP